MTRPTDYADATTPTWAFLLAKWVDQEKLTREEAETLADLISEEIWVAERKGYALGRAYRGRQQHGG